MALSQQMLPVSRANDITIQQEEPKWLIDSIWSHNAVGIIGGAPKCYKSWFGLDMAVSVASGTPCLGKFSVQQKGPVLVYLAEDSLSNVRARIESTCISRDIDIKNLELYVITSPILRLDRDHDQKCLQSTLSALRPRFLLLDPLVRLHRLDENSASDISRLLGFIRELQRTYNTAIVLVHHSSKKYRTQPGQALRGSSDLHAFGDSNAYLIRKNNHITLSIEHRSARAPDPIEIELISKNTDSETHLKIVSNIETSQHESLSERALALLQKSEKPLPRTLIRQYLKVNNQRLGETLDELDKQGLVMKTSKGWMFLTSRFSNTVEGLNNG